MLKLSKVISVVNGQCAQKKRDIIFNNISIDTRTIKKGDLFIAIKGNAFDGHDFIEKAVRAGASAVIVHRKISDCDVPIIKVKDTVKALGQIASWYRDQFKIPVIAVTGSVGKTTTKNYIAHVLNSKFPCLSSDKSFNNHIGVPLTLLKLSKKHKAAVIEIGTNQKGDIAYLAKMVKPTIAVITKIGDSHLEGLKNREGVGREKLSLCRFLQKNGMLIYNGNDEYLAKLVKKQKGFKKISCGFGSGLERGAENVCNSLQNKTFFDLQGKTYTIPTVASYTVLSAIIAVFCGEHFKISYNTINTSMKSLPQAPGRMCLKKVRGIYILDDTYNANPVSSEAAINTLVSLEVKGERIAVIGDMLELGKDSKKFHRQLAEHISNLPVNSIFTFGNFSKEISNYLKKHPLRKAKHFSNMNTLIKSLLVHVKKGDCVLVKGSRSMHTERVVEALVK